MKIMRWWRAEDLDLLGFEPGVHGKVRVLPIPHHAQPLKAFPLHIYIVLREIVAGVKFPMHDDLGKLGGYDKGKLFFVIWTTTIWTLPGNLAIALHPRDSYALVKAGNGEVYIVAEALPSAHPHSAARNRGRRSGIPERSLPCG